MRTLPFVARAFLRFKSFLDPLLGDDFKGSSFITIPEPLPNGRASIYLKMQ